MPYFVYIMASKRNGTLYAGVTSDLAQRVHQYKEGHADGFTKKYGVNRLVFYEIYDDVRDAIQREKSIKKYLRTWKLNLIEQMNPEWKDLTESLNS